jgi:hypothetical protein
VFAVVLDEEDTYVFERYGFQDTGTLGADQRENMSLFQGIAAPCLIYAGCPRSGRNG